MPALCVGMLALGLITAHAQEVVVKLPLVGNQPIPAGFSAAPFEQRTSTGRIDLPLLGLAPTASVFVTFVFEERGGDSILVSWLPDDGGLPRVLSSNLCEGVRGWNQRTLRIPADIAPASGRIVVQEGSSAPLVRSILLRWMTPQSVFVDGPVSQTRLVNGDGRVLSDEQLDGESFLPPPDAWFGDVVEAYLHSGIEALDQTLEFWLSVDRHPDMAVLRAEFLGLANGSGTRVWVNERFAGWLIPATTDLRDPGYFKDESGRLRFAGWRKGSLLIDPALLTGGETSVVIEGVGSTVFLKNAALQLMFGKPAGPAMEPEVLTGPDLLETPSLVGEPSSNP